MSGHSFLAWLTQPPKRGSASVSPSKRGKSRRQKAREREAEHQELLRQIQTHYVQKDELIESVVGIKQRLNDLRAEVSKQAGEIERDLDTLVKERLDSLEKQRQRDDAVAYFASLQRPSASAKRHASVH